MSKVICVGRNYADHAKELGNAVPTSPILFSKPTSSIVTCAQGIDIQDITQAGKLGSLHFECELSVRIGSSIKNATLSQAKEAIDAVTLGLDLTLRDIQNTLKEKGHPWERAKAFDGACVLGNWVSSEQIADYTNTHYELAINGATRQVGNTSLMLFPVFELLVDISKQFTLNVGDIIMTGTPKGVGALHQDDAIEMVLTTAKGDVRWQTQVR